MPTVVPATTSSVAHDAPKLVANKCQCLSNGRPIRLSSSVAGLHGVTTAELQAVRNLVGPCAWGQSWPIGRTMKRLVTESMLQLTVRIRVFRSQYQDAE